MSLPMKLMDLESENKRKTETGTEKWGKSLGRH